MVFDPEQLGRILPEEQLAVAVAIADRAARSQIITESITAQITGIPATEKTPEEVRAAHLGRSTLMLLQVEDPSRLLTLRELTAVSSSDADYERQAEAIRMSQSGDPELVDMPPIDASVLKDFHVAFLGELQTGAGVDDILTEDFARQLAASKRTATEHGVELVTVYTDDNLYYEASRAEFTPEEEADKVCRIIDTTTGDMVQKIALQMLDTILPAELKEEITKDELDMLAMEMQLDPNLQAQVAASGAVMQEVLSQTFLYHFIKTYGYDAINQLAPQKREKLLPKMPLAKEVSELIRSEP